MVNIFFKFHHIITSFFFYNIFFLFLKKKKKSLEQKLKLKKTPKTPACEIRMTNVWFLKLKLIEMTVKLPARNFIKKYPIELIILGFVK